MIPISYWYLFENGQFIGGVHFFSLRLGMSFLGKFGPKSQNCQFKLKFGTYTNSNYFFLFSIGNTFLDKLGPKNQNCQLSWNLVLRLIRVWRIQWWRSDRKDSFLRQICYKKSKLFCWSWNLEPRLIRICRIRWWFSIFPFLDQKCPFTIN